jgi:hypothetical protein
MNNKGKGRSFIQVKVTVQEEMVILTSGFNFLQVGGRLKVLGTQKQNK